MTLQCLLYMLSVDTNKMFTLLHFKFILPQHSLLVDEAIRCQRIHRLFQYRMDGFHYEVIKLPGIMKKKKKKLNDEF